MALISHKVSVMSLLSLSALFLMICCVTADNKTSQPSYKMVSLKCIVLPDKYYFLGIVKRDIFANIDSTLDITDSSMFPDL